VSGGDTAERRFLQALCLDPDHPVAFFGTFPVFEQKKQVGRERRMGGKYYDKNIIYV
jgi:hypothetical protein